jgi:hypothetical protein
LSCRFKWEPSNSSTHFKKINADKCKIIRYNKDVGLTKNQVLMILW